MGRDLYRKSELEALAAKYAQNVVTHKGFRPEDLPEIARNQEWKQASPGQRDKACRTIRDMARSPGGGAQGLTSSHEQEKQSESQSGIEPGSQGT